MQSFFTGYLVDDKLFHGDQALAGFLAHSAQVVVDILHYLFSIFVIARQDLSQNIAVGDKGSGSGSVIFNMICKSERLGIVRHLLGNVLTQATPVATNHIKTLCLHDGLISAVLLHDHESGVLLLL